MIKKYFFNWCILFCFVFLISNKSSSRDDYYSSLGLGIFFGITSSLFDDYMALNPVIKHKQTNKMANVGSICG